MHQYIRAMMEWNYSHWRPTNASGAVTAEAELAQKVAFLSRPDTYGVDSVACRETHMSWVFLAGERAYKLKKPVRFPYLDFSTLARREAACRAETQGRAQGGKHPIAFLAISRCAKTLATDWHAPLAAA